MTPFDTYVVNRLISCATWLEGHGPGPKPVKSWYHPMVMRPNVQQAPDPTRKPRVSEQECEETYRCFLVLEPKLKQAVNECFFRGDIKTVDQKLITLQCSKQTYYNRLGRAYKELLGYMNDCEAGIALPVRMVDEVKRRRAIA